MASPSTSSAMRERILNHMNHPDHTDHLRLYLQHYNNLPPSMMGTPKLLDITLSSITVSAGRNKKGAYMGDYQIPLTPPMSDLCEARQRLTDLLLDAEPGVLTRWYVNLEGLIVGFGVVFGLWATWDGERQFAPGGFVREKVFWGNQSAAEFMGRWRVVLFWFILGIHVVEATVMHFVTLRKYGVRTGSGLWFAWMLSAFLEGYPGFKRIDKEMARVKGKEKDKKDH